MQNEKLENIASNIFVKCFFSILILPFLFIPTNISASKEKQITVVFRFDDYSSHSNTDFELKLINSFKKCNIPVTFGVIPYICAEDVHDPRPQNVVPLNSVKANILKDAIKDGILEVALHGYSHQTIRMKMNGGYTEFVGLDYNNQMQKIIKGKNLLEELLGVRITTFTPPWNSYDLNTIGVLEKVGFKNISANRTGVTKEFSQLRFLPATCNLVELREAVKSARKISDNKTIIVVLFHIYDFVEFNRRRGKISLPDLLELLTWVASQKDVQLRNIEETTHMIGDLDWRRFINYSSFFSSPLNRVWPSSFIERYSGYRRTYLSSDIVKNMKVKRFFFLVIFYITIFSLSIPIALVSGLFLFGRIRPLELAVKYGVLLPIFLWVYALHDLEVYFRGALVLDIVTGLYVGLGACLYKLRVQQK
jgi:peptidoglycan/xylan/chitin deacetylase (PgdA/CDA1 family)